MKDQTFVSRPKATHGVVSGPNYRFTVLTEALLRYEWAADNQFEDRASTFAVIRDFPKASFHHIDHGDSLEIITSRFHLSYDKKRFTPSGFLVDVKGRLTLWGAQWRYGNYEGTLGGTARTLDEVDGRTPLGVGVISRLGYAAIDDSKSMLFDGSGWVGSRKPGDRIDGYLFAYGHEYREAIKDFYALSGNQPILPRWALGNWWSRYYPYSADEYISLMDRFRKEEIPLSVGVVDMDWHLVRDERVTHTGWTGYTFDKGLFPDPTAFGREMHKRDLKITLNDHPHGGIHAFEDCYEEMAKALNHDTSHKNPILFDPTSKKFMDAFFNIAHRSVEKQACDFWWIDWQQGEHSRIPGIDPLWMLNHFQYVDTARGGHRSLIFSRYGGPGSHRYPVGFSGDSITSWASLDFQPEFTATASNIGYGWWSHDMGGHMGGSRDDELVTRWVQSGVFSPIFRLHSTMSTWQSKEPWLFRKESRAIIKDFLRLRHQMMPYLYTMNIRAAREGLPIVQPMYWEFPEMDEAYSVPNQFYFGSELVVAPITKPRNPVTHVASVRAWLPPGKRWVDIFSGIIYDGNRHLNLYRPLDQYPVLAGEGSIIPLDANKAPRNGGLNPDGFEILVIVGKNAQCSILEDPKDDSPEAKSHSPDTNERGSLIQYYQEEGKLSAKVTGRSWTFRFVSLTDAKLEDVKVLVDGKVSKDAKVETELYPSTPSLVVKVPQLSADKHEIEISIGKDPQLGTHDFSPRLFQLLLDFQADFAVKDQIWSILDPEHTPFGRSLSFDAKEAPLGVKVGQLMALGLDEALTGPVLELLLADSRS